MVVRAALRSTGALDLSLVLKGNMVQHYRYYEILCQAGPNNLPQQSKYSETQQQITSQEIHTATTISISTSTEETPKSEKYQQLYRPS